MQIFDSYNSTTFLYNGRKYVKNFIVKPIQDEAIAVYNAYDTRLQLISATHYSQVQVNGSTFDSQVELMDILVPMLFAKGAGTGEVGTAQDNIAKIYTYYIDGEGDVTAAEVSAKVNTQMIPMMKTETNTPLLVEVIRTFPTGGSKKYIFLFMKGKGWYGWSLSGGNTTPADFRLISTLTLTAEDVENDENNQINYLGVIEDGNFISVANAGEWDFLDTTKQYYFTFNQNEALYFALFIGEPGIYGSGGGNIDAQDFSESDFVITTNSEVQPVVIPNLQQVLEQGSSAYINNTLDVYTESAILSLANNYGAFTSNASEVGLLGNNKGSLRLTTSGVYLGGAANGVNIDGQGGLLSLRGNGGINVNSDLILNNGADITSNEIFRVGNENSTFLTFGGGDGLVVTSTQPTSRGLHSYQDFSPNYIPYSYVQKIYVDKAISAATSGLTTTSLPFSAITGAVSGNTNLQSALHAKQATLISGSNIKTINGQTLLGNGNITISGLPANLSGATNRILYAAPDGTPTVNNTLYFDPTTRTQYIGMSGATGRLDIASTVFKLKVQSNIASGNATIEFNNNQEDALSFVDSVGTVYMTLRSTNNNKGVILKQNEIFDQGIFYPVYRRQAAISSNGAGVRVYGKDSLNNDIVLPFSTDTTTALFEVNFMVKNATASQTISGKYKALVKRVGGTITVTPQSTETITNHTTVTGYSVGIEQSGNTSLRFYFQPDNGDSLAYTGAFTEIKYSIN